MQNQKKAPNHKELLGKHGSVSFGTLFLAVFFHFLPVVVVVDVVFVVGDGEVVVDVCLVVVVIVEVFVVGRVVGVDVAIGV